MIGVARYHNGGYRHYLRSTICDLRFVGIGNHLILASGV